MTETHEQYRERLVEAADQAMHVPPIDEEEAYARCYWPSQRQRELAAEAVATQVLRDLRHALFADMLNNQTQGWWPQNITAFAADHGIDLTEKE
jgi:4'-phosphopantetheinyl transferase EntD